MKSKKKNKYLLGALIVLIGAIVVYTGYNIFFHHDEKQGKPKPVIEEKKVIEYEKTFYDGKRMVKINNLLDAEHKYKTISITKVSLQEEKNKYYMQGVITNNSTKDIDLIKFKLIFVDDFGDELYKHNCSSGPIKANGGTSIYTLETDDPLLNANDYIIADQ